MAVDTQRSSVVALTMPASTVAYTNTTSRAATVNFYAGTVTVISVLDPVSGSFVQVAASSPATIHLVPGGQFKVTYSVVPTAIATYHPANPVQGGL